MAWRAPGSLLLNTAAFQQHYYELTHGWKGFVVVYGMVAIFGLLRMLKVRYVVLVIFLMVHILYIVAQSSHLILPHIGEADKLPRLVAYFLSGMTLFLFRDKIPFSYKLALLSALAIVVLSFFHLSELAMPICGSYLILYFAYSPQVKLHNFAKYGDFSYGLYIYAFPVQQLIIHVYKDGKGLNPYTLAILSFFVTLALSALSWHLIEKPFLSLKPKPKAVSETPLG